MFPLLSENMSNQAISDYITKQIFIEKNIVTYRLLSRQFSLHVNTAKNELATYHHNAPYQSQDCSATFLISGTKKTSISRHGVEDEDVDMDQTPDSRNEEVEEGDGEVVPQVHMSLVEGKDLEVAKATYDKIHTIHVYCLSPTSLVDPALICDRTEFVRQTDRAKGPEWAATVGRIVCDGIKKGKQPAIPSRPVAGPSTSKPAAPPEPVKRSNSMPSVKVKREPSFPNAEKGKEKSKPTGKLDFFTKAKEAKETKKPEEPKKIVKEESVVGNKTFFSRPAEKSVEKLTAKGFENPPAKAADKPAPSVVSAKSKRDEVKEPLSGIKRKFSTSPEFRDMTPDSIPRGKEPSGTRVKGKMILSDDEPDEPPVKPSKRRKSNMGYKSEGSPAMDSEAEKEGRALMDIDDDQVERVSHAPSTVVSELESEPESPRPKMEQDEDVDMEDDVVPTKQPPKKRKAKAAIPIGKNGLKKRKVTKTRTTKKNGYIMKEDYTDWESVDEGEPEPEQPAKRKSKPKAAAKKDDTENAGKSPSPPSAEGEQKKDETGTKKAPPLKTAAPKVKAKASVNVITQKGLMNFFGPKKT